MNGTKLLRSQLASSPTLDWSEFYNAFVEQFMPESLRELRRGNLNF